MSSATLAVYQPKSEKCESSLLALLFGIGIVGSGRKHRWFARDGALAQHWWIWCSASLIAFGITTGVGVTALAEHLGSRTWKILGDSAFVLSGVASSLASLALFVRFADRRDRTFDRFRENAYGSCLVHYAFVSWLQLALLNEHLPALNSGFLVFVGASLLSWGTAAILRRIPLGLRAR